MGEVTTFVQFFQVEGLLLLFKILILVLIFVYVIFSFIVVNRIRALNRAVYLTAAKASASLQIATIIFFLLAVSLFIATIVIV